MRARFCKYTLGAYRAYVSAKVYCFPFSNEFNYGHESGVSCCFSRDKSSAEKGGKLISNDTKYVCCGESLSKQSEKLCHQVIDIGEHFAFVARFVIKLLYILTENEKKKKKNSEKTITRVFMVESSSTIFPNPIQPCPNPFANISIRFHLACFQNLLAREQSDGIGISVPHNLRGRIS